MTTRERASIAASASERGAEPSAGVTVVPEGRKMLRLEVRNTETPIERKPTWIRTKAVMGPEYRDLKNLVTTEGLHTVCESAGCPNIFECWEDREATSSSAVMSAAGAATSARSTPASPHRSTSTSLAGWRSPSRRWACAMPP